ncbi:hypothetical protein [Paenibacillus sp. P22]|uniref:hypothetical protein n=1 Tax=Paenibacillus sp. P22 TaxID=483908 RepID=UPI0003903A5E|nr:hypothetical protein [Paenibacillus sp. P22]CDN41708.1 hypothetical protein BN871_AJ_00600 [Paenibacillus sp. P22]
MEPQTDWQKRSAAEIVAENRKSSLNFYSVMAWVVPIVGLLFSFFTSIDVLLIGIGFGVVISALGKIVSAIYDKQYNIR